MYASSCTPATARPLGSFFPWKEASHASASAVEHATLGTLGTLRAALSLGWCSLLIVVVLSIPRIGGEDGYWMNGLYEAFCIICIFPVIVSMGAGGKVTGKRSTAVCKFLGDISYPIYITHYPLVYTYTAWVCNNNATMAEGIPYMILTFVGAVVLAYACLKLYDEPVRKWLTDRFLKGKKK